MVRATSTRVPKNAEALSPNVATPNQKIHLDDVPNDIHHIIASELSESSPSTVLALGQSSKALREAVLPFVYRDLVLKKGAEDSKSHQAYRAILEKFSDDGECEVVRYVRSITVKDEVPTEDLMLILDKISEHGTLRKLSWETNVHIATSVLDKLHATWPDLELSVCVLNREKAKNHAHRQMDIKLLSSSLLRRLTYTVYNQGYRADEAARSEWPKLTQAIAEGGNLRVLSIDNSQDGTEYYGVKIISDTEDSGKLMRLDITPEIRLPALEEFTLRENGSWGSPTYLWDDAHVHLLRDATDWSRLRKLDFGGDRPDAFFSAFTGGMPNLKALRFGAQDGSIGPVKQFMASITALESLDIGRAEVAIDALLPTIMGHKDTLRELILRPTTAGYCQPQYIDLDRLTAIIEAFPLLERFGWDAPCKAKIDAKHVAMLSRMNLKKLDLFLHVPFQSSDFAPELIQNAVGSIPPPAFTKEAAKTAAIKLMEKVSQGQNQPLEWLTIHFTRTGLEDRAQPYLMFAELQVRRAKTGSGYEVRGRQEWVGVSTLADELPLMEE